jgi:hypothetical protein
MARESKEEVRLRARALQRSGREELIAAIPEVELHRHLKELFRAMEPSYLVEITHGPNEFGKDLVVVRRDNLGGDVIGVVVKAGGVKGRSVGEVDEIKNSVSKSLAPGGKKLAEIASQIEQALAIPATLPTLFNEIDVSRALVVLSGEMSKQARERLRKEVKGNFDIRDLQWLVDNFTEHYPQIFFEGRAVDFIEQRIQHLERKHCLSKRGKNLSEYFVEPLVLRDVPLVQIAKGELQVAKQDRSPISSLKQTLVNGKRAILIGDPGSGKSGALAKLAIDAYRKAGEEFYAGAKGRKVRIPVFVHALSILNLNNAQALLDDFFGDLEGDLRARFLTDVLMVDGLDEVTSEDRPAVLERAQVLATELVASLVVTSRRIELLEATPKNFEKYDLLHFEFGQAVRLFENIVSSGKSLATLKDGLARIRNQIPMIPLSLMFLVDLVEENKEIPASVTELYDRYYDMALGKFDSDKGIAILFEYHVKKKFLAALAYEQFTLKNRLEIKRDEFEAFLAGYADRYGWDVDQVRDFSREVERAGVIEVREQVIFRHRSILDYFSAFHIFDRRAEFHGLEDRVVELFFSDLWKDVAFFYVGLRRELGTAILERIESHGESATHELFAKFMSGRLLQAGWNSPVTIKSRGLSYAMGTVPRLRERVLQDAEAEGLKMPRAWFDLCMVGFGEISFGSGFLLRQITEFLSKLDKEEGVEEPLYYYQSSILLNAARHAMPTADFNRLCSKLEIAGDKLPASDKVAINLILLIIKREDRPASKALRRKLERLKKANPFVFKQLFSSTSGKQKKLALESKAKV